MFKKFVKNIKEEIKSEMKDYLEDYFLTMKDLFKIQDLDKKTVEELVKDYQYHKWSDLAPKTREYLEKRLGVEPFNIFTCFPISRYYHLPECVGKTYERIKYRLDKHIEEKKQVENKKVKRGKKKVNNDR